MKKVSSLPELFKMRVVKGCDRIGTKSGEEHVCTKYLFDPHRKVYIPELDCFEYLHNLEFLTVEDKVAFYK